jgi:uncharacterized flavoprotein (TIGR03862 family)
MNNPHIPKLAIVGGGPAGLMAAETAIAEGLQVDLYDGMGSVGRKFLIAGKGGLNLTHSDPFERFVERYAERSADVARWLRTFDADALRAWAREFGVETFVGTSGRVFPVDLKAAPLLRAWVRRLRASGVRFHMNHRWLGWDDNGALRFSTSDGESSAETDAVIFAMGGGSWPVLGSDGAWQVPITKRGIETRPLVPANCGFDVNWSEHLRTRHAGAPIKPVAISWKRADGRVRRQQGEFVLTQTGVEGSLIYAFSAELRDAIAASGQVTIELDLIPGRDLERLQRDLSKPRGKHSLSNHLRGSVGIEGAKAALLYEQLSKAELDDVATLAARIKALPVTLHAARPIEEAISSAGGVKLEALDEGLMARQYPGIFFAGEMLDWEAPTGGYLLTACYASGCVAGRAAAEWLKTQAR